MAGSKMKCLVMLQGMVGPEVNVAPGDPHTCDADEAARLVAAGIAKYAEDETAPRAPSKAGKREKAIERRPKAEKRGVLDRAKKIGKAVFDGKPVED